MKVLFIFRKPFKGNYSIENVFETITKTLYNYHGISCEKNIIPFYSKGLVERIKSYFFVKKISSEIYHITGDVNYLALALPPQKTIITFHDIGFLDYKKGAKRLFLYLFWLYLPARRARFITAVSTVTRDKIVECVPSIKNKIIVIPNPLTSGFENIPIRQKINTDYPVVLQIGTKSNKNIGKLIEGITGLRCRLVIVGRINDRLLKKLKKYKIDWENKVNLSSKELIETYKASDILSFISLYEGFGLPIIEGQAAGCIVISSNLEPMKSIAGSGSIQVNPTSVKEIRKAFESIIGNEELGRKIVLNGYENVKRFRAVCVAKQYLELYEKCIL